MRRECLPPTYQSYLARYGLDSLDPSGLMLLRFPRGAYVHRQGEVMEYLMVVVAGRSKVSLLLPDGKTLLLSFYSGQGLLGEVELLGGDLRASTTGQAVTDFLCIGIPMAQYGPRLLENPAFLRAAGMEMSHKLDRCCKNSALNLLQPLEARLCSYLLMAQEDGRLVGKLTELSELLGVSYRHLLRTMGRLCNEGILKKRGHTYFIVNSRALEVWAEAFQFPDEVPVHSGCSPFSIGIINSGEK